MSHLGKNERPLALPSSDCRGLLEISWLLACAAVFPVSHAQRSYGGTDSVVVSDHLLQPCDKVTRIGSVQGSDSVISLSFAIQTGIDSAQF